MACYAESSPGPALREHVACYWSLAADEPFEHRVLPDGCMDLLFDLRGGAELVGAMTRALAVTQPRRSRVFGVRFRPGEAFALIGVPAGDARDRVIALGDAWGRSGAVLGDVVAAAPDDAARVVALERALAGAIARPADRRVRRAVAQLIAAPATRIAAIAGELGLGERQLERAFELRVGIGPKQLARVARLQAIARRLAVGPAAWARWAGELGYADQAHLAREVRALAGVTPSALATEAARGRTWPVAMSDSFKPPRAARGTTRA
ncbi:MAG TPA: AraC family transcriptional regulator [Kofleriaceae bacterium]|nr:AraC family transcriptional regulator [Kofleriaceae bacterium]